MTITQAIKLLVVDDHPVVREGLSAMLSHMNGLIVLGEAPDGQQALDMVRELRPDVVLMDLRLPVLDGVAATERIVRDFPGTKVLILTSFDQDDLILSGTRAGAKGYLLKDSPRDTIVSAITCVYRGETVFHPSVASRMMVGASSQENRAMAPVVAAGGALSERESDVLRCLANGMSNKGIAERLHIAESTVKTHLGHLFIKLGVKDRTEAVTGAIRRGWLLLR
jgi:DNA-binding NarL/FixJ family response regulator